MKFRIRILIITVAVALAISDPIYETPQITRYDSVLYN
jgi:hypothetical protein